MTTRSDTVVASEASFTAADGSTERAELRGPEGERLVAIVHLPPSGPRGAVVICSPLLGEFMRNYRREVLLARELTSRGFAVERFHYRFTGNSDGEDEDLTYDSMRQDALAAVEDIRSRAPGGPLVLIGARWGAMIAASAAGEHPEADVVLWEPILETARYFKEAFRAKLVKERRDGAERPVTGRELEASLAEGRPVEVPGYRVFPNLYRTAIDRKLAAELGDAHRRLLAIQVGPTGSVRPELARHVDRWREAGLEVDASAVRGEESWWLIDERWHDEGQRPMTKELIAVTADWIEARSAEEGTS